MRWFPVAPFGAMSSSWARALPLRGAIVTLGVVALCSCTSMPPGANDSGSTGGGGGTSCTNTGEVACGVTCVQPKTDAQNCGSCGHACAATETCAGGECLPLDCNGTPCPSTQVCQDSLCVDRLCVGVLCAQGEVCAGGLCTMPHCGTDVCALGSVCVMGACVEAACVGLSCSAPATCHSGYCIGAACGDGMKNGSETAVDCGGATCFPCGVGGACLRDADCGSGKCTAMTCAAAASCTDGLRSGTETDLDCGGRACPGCPGGGSCLVDADCLSNGCKAGACVPVSCGDRVKSGSETDVDCGGSCLGCGAGRACLVGADCVSGTCTAGFCASPQSCGDGQKNGGETGLDCGGPACARCAGGQGCAGDGDCLSGRCTSGTCVAGSCTDGQKNGAESGVDCGGPVCSACPAGQSCARPGDCQSGVCGGGTCQMPTCFDAAQNGTETDVDCGGASTLCARCMPMQVCLMASDCNGGACVLGKCQAPSCTDGLKNGSETDRDCGGSSCPACQVGQSCVTGGNCVSRVCTGSVCVAATCSDGVKNGDEGGLDCGGSCTAKCRTGNSCTADADCEFAYCTAAKVCAITRERGPLWKMPDSPTALCVLPTGGSGPCPAMGQPLYGQDGNFQVNVPVYSVTADTVTDPVTGLMWERVGLASATSFAQAYDYCDALNLGGFLDWRVPTRIELVTLFDYSHQPAIDPAAFTNFPAPNNGPYVYSASALNLAATNMVAADFRDGATTSLPNSYIFGTVKCVRTVTAGAAGQLTAATDTVTDSRTGLVWQRSSSPGLQSWSAALAYCVSFSATGFPSGWRLPTAKELATLVEEVSGPPTIDLTAFPGTLPERYWSGSPAGRGSINTMSVDFGTGDVATAAATNTYRARCVH